MNAVATTIIVLALLIGGFGWVALMRFRSIAREAKKYERGLKTIPLLIDLPPSSDDIERGGRDERDVTEETISQAQTMYNIISSTATSGFKSKHLYGQRHLSFEIVASKGLVHYYVAVPVVLIDVIKQAVAAAYPTARLQEVPDYNIFSKVGKISGTIGGELTLKKDYIYPIALFGESKRDAMRAILNALSAVGREDGAAIQILLRPAPDGWSKKSVDTANKIREAKGIPKSGLGGLVSPKELLEALWKPPEPKDKKDEKQLSNLDQATVESIEEKTRYPAYEVLIRIVSSSNIAARSQAILKNIISAFSLFDSPGRNGFKYSAAKNIEQFTTAFIFRFFPLELRTNVLNSIELATIFHLPDQSNIPTSQVKRQLSKQVDGPTEVMEEGVLLGYNEFRGIKKPIRLGTNDRRRHTYIIGQTGTGKSVLLENIAYQDMMDGRGFAFVDPHGDSVEALLSKIPRDRVEDVIYFNPSDMDNPIGLNMFEFDNPDQKDFLVQEAINMLYGLYDPGHTGIVGPRLEHIFRNCALLLMSDPAGGTFIDIPKCLIDPDFVKGKLKYVTDQTVLDFWTKEFPASQRSNEAGEVISWVVSKFGPFISNDSMRNIIGQTKSGFNLREIMDNKKILLVNLSKGKMGELNSKLLGIIFVMKFQAAAMSRANVPEADRQDFSLFVDEFQNFATDSFESILSEARKYRLNLVLGNQFMTQLTEKIREAIIGNVGTVISGRIGITDAEVLIKKYAPTFETEDLTKMPNHESIASVMINNIPSAPFSMAWIPPMGQSNAQLSSALKRLSAAKYGRSRAEVEAEIFKRLQSSSPTPSRPVPRPGSLPAAQPNASAMTQQATTSGSGSSFLDEWLAKRKQTQQGSSTAASPSSNVSPATASRPAAGMQPPTAVSSPLPGPLNPPFVPAGAPQAQHSSISAVPIAQPSPSTHLAQLQSKGIGDNVDFTRAADAPAAAVELQNDTFDLQHQLQQTMKSDVMKSAPKNPDGTLKTDHTSQMNPEKKLTTTEVTGISSGNQDELDEIYIDLRGKIHHRADD